MAFSAPRLACLAQGGDNSLWSYRTTDTASVVVGSDYFPAGAGLSIGDVILAQTEIASTNAFTFLRVLTLAPVTVGVIGTGGGGGGSATVPVTTIASSGASQTLAAPLSGDIAYDITLTANTALTLAGGTAGQMQRIVLWLRQDATGGRTPTLPPQGTTVRYAGGAAPTFSSTAAGVILRVTFETLDGGQTWLGLSGGV